jgi:hypothetical protein
VLLGVFLRGVIVVLRRMQSVAMRDFGMVRGFLVISGLRMLGRLAMVLGRMFMMLRGHFMVLVDVMFANIVTVHCCLPDSRHRRMSGTSSRSMN